MPAFWIGFPSLGVIGQDFRVVVDRLALGAIKTPHANIFDIGRLLVYDQRELDHHAWREAVESLGFADREWHDHRIHVTGNVLTGYDQGPHRTIHLQDQALGGITLRRP